MMRLGMGLSRPQSKSGPPPEPPVKWQGYPDSPKLASEYPYQMISKNAGNATLLLCSKNKIWHRGDGGYSADGAVKPYYELVGGAWVYRDTISAGGVFGGGTILQSNCDVYTAVNCALILFPKTPSDASVAWWDYPASPRSLIDDPYQVVYVSQYSDTLVTSKQPMVRAGTSLSIKDGYMYYREKTGPWLPNPYTPGPVSPVLNLNGETLVESRGNVFDQSLLSVMFNNTVGKDKYQQWDGLPPDSPVSVAIYPYQCIRHDSGDGRDYLYCTSGQFYKMGNGQLASKKAGVSYRSYQGGGWISSDSFAADSGINVASGVTQTNIDIYGEETLTTVYKTKTTAK